MQGGFLRPSYIRAGMTTAASHFSALPTLTLPNIAAGVMTRWPDIWREFANEVKSNPTRPLTFQGAVFDEFLIHEELAGTRTVRVPADTVLYRARLCFVRRANGDEPYRGTAIGAAPPERAGPGRANAMVKVVYTAPTRKVRRWLK